MGPKCVQQLGKNGFIVANNFDLDLCDFGAHFGVQFGTISDQQGPSWAQEDNQEHQRTEKLAIAKTSTDHNSLFFWSSKAVQDSLPRRLRIMPENSGSLSDSKMCRSALPKLFVADGVVSSSWSRLCNQANCKT